MESITSIALSNFLRLKNIEMSIETCFQSKRDSIIRISKKYINAYKVSLSRFCKDGFGDGFE